MDISEVLMVEINLQLDKLFFPFLWRIKKNGNVKRKNVQHGKVANVIAIIK